MAFAMGELAAAEQATTPASGGGEHPEARLRVEADGRLLADVHRPVRVVQVSLPLGEGVMEIVVRAPGALVRARAGSVTRDRAGLRLRGGRAPGGPGPLPDLDGARRRLATAAARGLSYGARSPVRGGPVPAPASGCGGEAVPGGSARPGEQAHVLPGRCAGTGGRGGGPTRPLRKAGGRRGRFRESKRGSGKGFCLRASPVDRPTAGPSPFGKAVPTALDSKTWLAVTVDSPTNSSPARKAPRTPVASSVSGRRARRSPSSPTSASTRCSTAARSPPASRSATAARSSSTRTWAWSPRSSTSPSLRSLHGHLAIGHCRYSTTGSSVWENAQPTFRATAHGAVALGHNGNLINTGELAQLAAELPHRDRHQRRHAATTDTDAADRRCSPGTPTAPSRTPRSRSCPQVQGAFSLVFMDENTLYAARDPQGIRPLVLGRLERGWVVASETAALDIVGATFVREIEPGELIAIDEHGLRSRRFAEAEPKGCLFEYVYLARPDTTIAGRSVHATRVEVGRRLARERPVEADLVIPTPESGTPAAIGYAEASGIPYGQGLVKNAYVGRTFIQPCQTIRQLGIRLKLNPLREVIEGKRLVVVDDSIVRGNTQRALVRMLREAGRRRGARADLLAAGEVAVLLRHRLRHPGRADRQRPDRRGDPHLARRRLARLHLAGRLIEATTQPDGPALPGLLRRGLPDRAARRRSCSASTLLEARSQQPQPRLAAAADRDLAASAAARRPPADALLPPPAQAEGPTEAPAADFTPMPERAAAATSNERGATYAAAGVDIEAGRARRRADEGSGSRKATPARGGRRPRRLRRAVRRLRAQRYERPLLATSTDGVGTKVAHRRSAWTCTTRSASTWSAWSSTTSSCAAPSRCS